MSRSYYCKDKKETECEKTGKTIEIEIGDLWGTKLVISPNCNSLQRNDYCQENQELCPYKKMKTSELKAKFFPQVYTDNFDFE